MIYYPPARRPSFQRSAAAVGPHARAGLLLRRGLAVGDQFPAAYDRTLFAFEWSRNWIMAVDLDEDSNLERLEAFLPQMSFIRPIDMQFDHNGSV